MNKIRRKKITITIMTLKNYIVFKEYDSIESIKDEIEDILWEEEDSYDNMPENLQYSIRGEESNEAIDNLEDAVDFLEEVIDIFDSDKDRKIKEKEMNNYINQAIYSLKQII